MPPDQHRGGSGDRSGAVRRLLLACYRRRCKFPFINVARTVKGSGRTMSMGLPPEEWKRTVPWRRAAGPLVVVLVVVAALLVACGGSP